MPNLLTLGKAEKRGSAAVILAALLGALVCGQSRAATDLEARYGERDGAIYGLLIDNHVQKAHVGALLEVGEGDSVALLGRLSKAWHGTVTPYIGVGAGIAVEEQTDIVQCLPVTDRQYGLALEAYAGLRGRLATRTLWFLEASARDQEVQDGFGATAGLRFRLGK